MIKTNCLCILICITLILPSFFGCRHKPQHNSKLPVKFDPKLSAEERIESLYQLGVIAGTTGKLDLAEQQFKLVLKDNPQHQHTRLVELHQL